MGLGLAGGVLSDARADELDVGSAFGEPGATIQVPVRLDKANPVVGVQFVLKYPESHVESGQPSVVSEGSDHLAASSDDLAGRRGVVVLSRSNQELPADFDLALPVRLLANSPAGGPSLSVEEIVFTDAQGNTFAADARYTVVEEWRRANFTPAEREVPDIIGDDRDPDGDGIVNLDELGGATLPRVPDFDSGSSGLVEVAADGRVTLRLRFRRARDPAVQAAAPVVGETGTDLGDWSRDGVVEEATGGGDAEAEEIEARVEAPAGDPRRFLRVRTIRAESGDAGSGG